MYNTSNGHFADTVVQGEIQPEIKNEDFDRHLFSLEEGDNIEKILRDNKASFTVEDLNTAIHNILGSRLGVGEFFRDRYNLLYSTGEYSQIVGHLEQERTEIEMILQNSKINNLPIGYIDSAIGAIGEKLPSIHPEELRARHKMMQLSPRGKDITGITSSRINGIGEYVLPTPIEKCIGGEGKNKMIVGRGKSAQIVISTVTGTNKITGVCMTYGTPSFDEAYENELQSHYPTSKKDIRSSMEKIYGALEDGIMVFPVIGMIPKYASLRSMMRMMRDWAKELISDEFAYTPGIAEMDMTNNFFELCSRQLSVKPLILMDKNGDPISATNNRLDYYSTVTTFRAISAIEKARGGINSVIPRKSFDLRKQY